MACGDLYDELPRCLLSGLGQKIQSAERPSSSSCFYPFGCFKVQSSILCGYSTANEEKEKMNIKTFSTSSIASLALLLSACGNAANTTANNSTTTTTANKSNTAMVANSNQRAV